jgi:alpha-1,2-mannosyltransferase
VNGDPSGSGDAATASMIEVSVARPIGAGLVRPRRLGPGPAAVRAYWLSPPGMVMLAATGLALALRLFMLSRSGFLTGVTEYDDGVYLGGAVRLISGALPYHGFAFVQPPGILLLMAPVAVIAKVSTATHAMAAARLLTVLASTACVPLAGSLVRFRGVFVTLVTCGLLAVYPDDITTAHTLILEPWMNLLLLTGVGLAFRCGRAASPRRLLWAGVAMGFAAAVKYWAALPALGLLVVCLLSGPAGRKSLAPRYVLGALAGFAVPVLPFALAGPGLFLRSTLLDQASRAGTWVPASLRLAHITGLVDFLDVKGDLSLRAGTHSLFASGGVATAQTTSAGWATIIAAAMIVAALILGYARSPGRSSPLEWYALATCAGAVAAVLAYSAFFYHYADFAAPWLALSSGCAAGALGGVLGRRPRARRALLAGAAIAIVGVGAFQVRELAGLHTTSVYPDKVLIPAGACVVTDEVSLTISANRFSTRPGCPDVLDALAVTLVEDNGVSVQGGAKALPRAVAAWQWIFSRAQYVWLSADSDRRIPWTHALTRWFGHHFKPRPAGGGATGRAGGLGRVYQRRT